ncbi:MAG: hypothetical protein ABR550_08130, partial [Wenzhouxiangellaceae bacterium]
QSEVPQPEQPEAPVEPPEKSSPSATMTGERLIALLGSLDPEAQRNGNGLQFSIGDRVHILIFDPEADRMRLMSPIAEAEILGPELMQRILQANFDSALDARYALAQGIVWSVFVHPLSTLNEDFLASALGQVHSAAETFGTTFSSGMLTYGGGDSQARIDELIEALEKLTNPTL